MHRPALPAGLNLGSGKDFRDDYFNIDVDDTWAPDAVCDLSAVDPARGVVLSTVRFGEVTLRPACFDKIIANDVLEHVPDLMAMMSTCLQLLRLGGVFQISVPYDLSFGAWQDPTHVRAFNERSWLYYTDWFWYMGWSEYRFALDSFEFVPSPLGNEMKDRNVPREEIIRTPRAIDSMTVALRKIALTPEDRATWQHWRERKRLAQERQRLSALAASSPRIQPIVPGSLKAFDVSLASSLDRYCIWVVTPPDYSHQLAYDDVALGLSEAFTELGGSAPIIRDPGALNGRTLIVLGPQLLPPSASTLLPADSILFNLEQVDGKSPWISENYLSLLRQRPVLDYSLRNQAALVGFGIDHARVLPVGYAPSLTRIAPAEKDIDVLFYGSLNDRRRHVLEALQQRGVIVLHLFDVYGAERDRAIGRAKIVINVHFYEAAIFESIRVSLLLANSVCVVSEGVESDPDLASFVGGLAIVPYESLVDCCIALLADPVARDTIGRAGFQTIERRRQADLLKALFAS